MCRACVSYYVVTLLLLVQVALDAAASPRMDEFVNILRHRRLSSLKRAVSGVDRRGPYIFLTWFKECSYNNAFAWVVNALKKTCHMQQRIRFEMWPVTRPSESGAGAGMGAPPAPPAPEAALTPLARPMKRPAARVTPGSKRRRWASGTLPQEAEQEMDLDLDALAVEGAVPRPHMPCAPWLLQKIFQDPGMHDPKGLKPFLKGVGELPDSFAGGSFLGEGGFAWVYHYPKHVLGDVVLKVLKVRDMMDFLAEVHLGATLNHPNIISCIDVVVCKQLALVMPYGGQSLRDRVKRNSPSGALPEYVSLTKQMMSAVAWLHDCDLVHTDLKPANMVVDSTNRLRLVDLGSIVVDRPEHRRLWHDRFAKVAEIPCGTLWYRAPETLLGWTQIKKTVDVWATACSIWEVWVGSPLFKAWTVRTMTAKILRELGRPQGHALELFITLPNWRREFTSRAGATLMTWKQRCNLALPKKGFGDWLTPMLAYNPSDRPSSRDHLLAFGDLRTQP